MSTETTSTDATISRRSVLVLAGTTGLLAACGGGSDDSSTDQGGGDSGGTDSGGTDSGTSGEVLAAVADVPVGGGSINTDLHVVVTQPEAGTYKAFTSICTHMGCDVSSVSNNVILCICHQSKFSAETGDVQDGPAPRALSSVAVMVEGDNVVRA